MFDRRILTKHLSQLGFRQVGPLQYELAPNETEIHKYLSFRLRGVYRWELEGTVGFKHVKADTFAWHCLSEFAGDLWKQARSTTSGLPFVTQFYISKLASWGPMQALNIKELTAEESAVRIKSDIETFVLPFIFKIDSPRAFLDFLLADEEPMPWHQWGPLHRLAQIIYLATQENLPAASLVLPRVEQERNLLVNQLDNVALETYIAKIVEAAELKH